MSEEVLADDIDCIVIGDGAVDFMVRLFKKNHDVFQVNQWGGITQITKVVSTENLWLHFNFWVVNEDTIELVTAAIRGEFYLGIVTYYVEDVSSFEKAQDLYDRYFQDSILPSTSIASNNRGMIPYQVFSEDLYIFNMQAATDSQELVGAGLIAALCPDSAIMTDQLPEPDKEVKFIASSMDPLFTREKTGVFLWMFENYRRKNQKLTINELHTKELKSALDYNRTESCSIL